MVAVAAQKFHSRLCCAGNCRPASKKPRIDRQSNIMSILNSQHLCHMTAVVLDSIHVPYFISSLGQAHLYTLWPPEQVYWSSRHDVAGD
jgi:hypothetical protein